jgi:hypothetical protein
VLEVLAFSTGLRFCPNSSDATHAAPLVTEGEAEGNSVPPWATHIFGNLSLPQDGTFVLIMEMLAPH